MKKFLLCALVVMLLAVPCSCSGANYWEEGHSGDSWEDAYIIDSSEDFETMRSRNISETVTENGKYFKLAVNLNLTISATDGAIYFTGHFDGQGNTINIAISEANDYLNFASLFYKIDTEGTEPAVKNLKTTGTLKGEHVAGLVCTLQTEIIENCSFNGNLEVPVSDFSMFAGGIAAEMRGGTGVIRKCTVNATISGGGNSSTRYSIESVK